MLDAKLNINGVEIHLTGDKEDIVYALRNATSSSISNKNEKEIIQKVSTEPVDTKKSSKYSKEDLIKMYNYLARQGNYVIKQFSITRGGKTNPVQYTVCLAFDESKQRYYFYNPKSEDKYIQSYQIKDVIEKINDSESGFSLLHTVANRILEKLNVVNGLEQIVKKDPFPTKKVIFKNYQSKTKLEKLREAGRKGGLERARRARLRQTDLDAV